MKKSKYAMIACLVVALGIGGIALSNKNSVKAKVSLQDARNIVLDHANIKEDDVLLLKIDEEGNNYEIDVETSNFHYDYKINMKTGKVEKVEKEETIVNVEYQGKMISNNEAQYIALNHANLTNNKVTNLKVENDIENKHECYEVEFNYKDKEYEYHILKKGGTILSYEIKNKKQEKVTHSNMSEISSLVLERVPGASAKHLEIKQDFEDGRMIYEGEIHYDGYEYEFEVDAETKEFIEWDKELENVQASISIEKAKKIALNKVQGASNKDLEIELDDHDGKAIYEGEINYQNKEYEFEIDANTGTILKWIVEVDD